MAMDENDFIGEEDSDEVLVASKGSFPVSMSVILTKTISSVGNKKNQRIL